MINLVSESFKPSNKIKNIESWKAKKVNGARLITFIFLLFSIAFIFLMIYGSSSSDSKIRILLWIGLGGFFGSIILFIILEVFFYYQWCKINLKKFITKKLICDIFISSNNNFDITKDFYLESSEIKITEKIENKNKKKCLDYNLFDVKKREVKLKYNLNINYKYKDMFDNLIESFDKEIIKYLNNKIIKINEVIWK